MQHRSPTIGEVNYYYQVNEIASTNNIMVFFPINKYVTAISKLITH